MANALSVFFKPEKMIYLDLSVHIRRTFRVPTPKRRRRISGQTPYDLAEVEGHRQVMGLLRPASWQPFWSHDEDQPSWITYLILPV